MMTGAEQDGLFVVSQNGQLEPARNVEALDGVRTVTNDVSKTYNLLNALALDIFKNGRQGFEVAVDVGENCFHFAGFVRVFRKLPGPALHRSFAGYDTNKTSSCQPRTRRHATAIAAYSP